MCHATAVGVPRRSRSAGPLSVLSFSCVADVWPVSWSLNLWSTADRIAVWSEVARLPQRQRHVLYQRYRADLDRTMASSTTSRRARIGAFAPMVVLLMSAIGEILALDRVGALVSLKVTLPPR